MIDLWRHKNVLLSLDRNSYYDDQAEVLRDLMDSGKKCVYVTFNQGFKAISRFFNKHQVHSQDVLFIDMVSHTRKDSLPERKKNCLFIQHPGCLTDLSLALNEIAHSDHSHKVIVVDSIESALMHNDSRVVFEFLRHLKHNSNRWGTRQIIITIGDKETEMHQFAPLFDDVSRLKDATS